MKRNTNNTLVALTSLASGLKKTQPKGLFLIDGAKYTANQLVTILQTIITALQAVPVAKGTYLAAVKSADALLAQYNDVTLQLKQSLQNQAKDDVAALAVYGLTPRKRPGVRTPKVSVAAADKALATRAARHTMGPKQKLQITGASVAAANAAQALASAGITNAAAPSSAPAFATPPAAATPAATAAPIVAALPSATPLVTTGH